MGWLRNIRSISGENVSEEWREIRQLEKNGDVAALSAHLDNPKTRSFTAAGTENYFTVRGPAARALGHLKADAAVERIIPLLSDPVYSVRLDAATALGDIGGVVVIDPLIQALGDEDPNVRIGAARSLGKVQPPEAVSPLERLLEDPHREVRRAAADALAEIADPSSDEAIGRAARRDGMLHGWPMRRAQRKLHRNLNRVS